MNQSIPKNITEASQLIRSGLLTSENLVKHYLQQIQQMNPILNAFITIAEKQALENSKLLDNELKEGKYRGVLHGIPIVIKDNIDTKNIATTIGSQLFRNRQPIKNAIIVEKLIQAGAVILGKTNLSEFAADISGNNHFYGNTRNFWNSNHSPGGSSSGAATAVAANLCLGGIGTDTGGSIRIPASWSGVIGLRPTYGLISSHGIFPRAFSFDTVGIMANSIEDVAILLNTLSPSPINLNLSTFSLSKVNLGIVKNYTFSPIIESEIANKIYQAITNLKQLGVNIINIESPFLNKDFKSSIYSNIALYEFNQVLGKESIANPNIFSQKVKSDLFKGNNINIFTYKKAQIIRQKQISQFSKIFKLQQVDLLLTPTTPITAPPINFDSQIYQLNRLFILPFSFAGLPAISIPYGFTKKGLPIGLQIIGNFFDEALILQLALALMSFK
jgi:aspartyl-tRNA(Asn)/glutamyl-tRNA(Gln) amidotransferase subunit A